MKCPNCGNDVPARPTCERCGANLFGSPGPTLPATALGPVSQPLTAGQKARLLGGLVPLAGFALLVVGYFVAARMFNLPPPSPLLYVFILVVFAFIGYGVVQNLRDFGSGVARVEEDLLNRTWLSRGGNARPYGRFERLGTMRLGSRADVNKGTGARYRVVYSPASKIAWALEPPDARTWEP